MRQRHTTRRWNRRWAALATGMGLSGALGLAWPAPAGAQALNLDVAPAAGPWFTTVTVSGTACSAEPAAELVVTGHLGRAGGDPIRLGRFEAFPDDSGAWSAQVLVTHHGDVPDSSEEPPVTPGDYTFVATCGPLTRDGLGNPIPGEPVVATYTGAFEVLPGGSVPTVQAPSTITIDDGDVEVTVSGDRCVRPGGPSNVLVDVEGPAGADADSRYDAVAHVPADADGRWTATLTPAPTTSGPKTPTPGVYEVDAQCLLGDSGLENLNAFTYAPATVTLVAAPTTPSPRPPAPVPVRATPVYTG